MRRFSVRECMAPLIVTGRNSVPLLSDQESNSRASIKLTHVKSIDYGFSTRDHKRLGRANLSACNDIIQVRAARDRRWILCAATTTGGHLPFAQILLRPHYAATVRLAAAVRVNRKS